MFKAGADVLIRAKVLADGRLLVAPGAVIEPHAVDVLGDIEHGKGFGEQVGMVMFFRSEQDRQKFADGLGSIAA